MTEIIKNSAPIVLNEIKNAKHILLHCHPSPDPDSLGSALAMKLAIESLNKKVTLIKGDNEIPKAFVFPAVDTIVQKSFCELNINEFDLFIILDSAHFGMVSSKFKDTVFPDSLKTIVIDHHASTKEYGNINCIDSTYPATAQMVFDLLKEMNIPLNHDIALNIFMGIYGDTGGFQYGNINSDTFRIVSELTKFATDFKDTVFTMKNSNSRGRLIFERLMLSSIEEYYNSQLVIASISFEQLKNNNIKDNDYRGSEIINIIKSIIGFDIVVSMIESEEGKIEISFRTRDINKYDLSKLALALGGGGHKGAAGAELNMTLDKAKETLVEKVKLIYNI